MSDRPDTERSNPDPGKIFEGNPPRSRGEDFFSLETVLSVKASMAVIAERVDNLREASRTHSEKLDKIEKDVHVAKVALYVGAAAVTLGAGIVVWFINQAMQILRPLIQNAIQ